jgi:hypothetical protein
VTLDDPPAVPTLKDPGEALAWLDLEHANLAVTVHYATEHSWPTRAEQLDHLLHHYVTMRGRSPDILTPAIMRP